MTIRYVGSGGDNGNSGLTWALRKLTLNGVEDTPVVAGDTVYVGPGVYRETLTADVAGSSGQPITYIGDVTGENTDGVGGIVRITGSDNDQVKARNYGIIGSYRGYRTYRGFFFDTADNAFYGESCSYNIIEDCYIESGEGSPLKFITSAPNLTIRRCYINHIKHNSYAISFYHSSVVNDQNILIENVIISGGQGIQVGRFGGITVKNFLIIGGVYGINVTYALDTGQTVIVNNGTLCACGTALGATTTGEIIEDYNTFWGNQADRSSVATGSNSVAWMPLFLPSLFCDGFDLITKIPYLLSEWSQIAHKVGSSEASDDLFGITRPTISSKKSWGPIQYRQPEREISTTRGSSAASIKLDDAGEHMIFVPVDAVSTTIKVYAYRQANYTGTLPRMIIRQPGQSDRVITDTGAVGQWNLLTDTFTPASDPPYVIVILRSLNTATSGSYATFFDDLSKP